MKPFVFFVAFVVASSTPALARIGDTQAAVEQSLGKGYTSDDDAPFKVPANCVYRSYAKGDIWCGVYFLQGKSICECYGKYGNIPFSKVELSGFLAANANGQPWKESVDGSITSWSTEDNSLIAGHPLSSRNLLVIRTPSFDRLTAQEAQAQDRQRVGDFFAAATPTPAPSTPKV